VALHELGTVVYCSKFSTNQSAAWLEGIEATPSKTTAAAERSLLLKLRTKRAKLTLDVERMQGEGTREFMEIK
jgi:hypothetical protein